MPNPWIRAVSPSALVACPSEPGDLPLRPGGQPLGPGLDGDSVEDDFIELERGSFTVTPFATDRMPNPPTYGG